MSMILDALKRAERERSMGRAPQAGEVANMTPMPAPKRQRDRLVIGVLVVLLLAAAVVIAALVLRHRVPAGAVDDAAADASGDLPKLIAAPEPSPTTAEPAAVAPAQPEPQRLNAAAPPEPQRLDAAAQQPTIAQGNRISNLDDVAPQDNDAGEQAAAATVAAASRPPAQPARPPAPHSAASSPPPDEVDDDTPAAEAAPARLKSGASPTQSAGALASQADQIALSNGAQPLSQMPEAFRANFPPLNIDVHVYDEDPKRRFVMVGSQILHEGGTLPSGPTIVAIVPDGLVLGWQGQRVLYSLTH